MSSLVDKLREFVENAEADEKMDYLEKMRLKFYLQELIAEEEMKEFLKEN